MPNTAKGVWLALISTALFTLVGVLVRWLSESLDVFQILLFRQMVFMVVLLPAMLKAGRALFQPKFVALHCYRVVGAFIALYGGFVTVAHIPLADATALSFTQVLFVAVISSYFLGEQVNLRRLVTIGVGFIGVMLVVQPQFSDEDFYFILLGLIAAIGAAAAVISVRKMAQTESRLILLVYQAVFVGAVALFPAILNWQTPNAEQWALLLLVGIISSCAQWIGITAYKWGEANVVSNVEYAKMVYSMALGYWLFDELPNTLAFFGAGLIIASAIVPLLLTKKSKR
ncbi:DMT family transporter [Vibrio sp. SCSIO 43136]|nr:DMT family transporter [Vibrio sp. SCSIO 43136]